MLILIISLIILFARVDRVRSGYENSNAKITLIFFSLAWFGCPSEANLKGIFHNILFVQQIQSMVGKHELLSFKDIPFHNISKFTLYSYVYKMNRFEVTQSSINHRHLHFYQSVTQ